MKYRVTVEVCHTETPDPIHSYDVWTPVYEQRFNNDKMEQVIAAVPVAVAQAVFGDKKDD